MNEYPPRYRVSARHSGTTTRSVGPLRMPSGNGGDDRQGLLPGGTMSVRALAFALARLSARFSFSDLPAFLDRCCRGDLSAMAAPKLGAWLTPYLSTYPLSPPGQNLGGVSSAVNEV